MPVLDRHRLDILSLCYYEVERRRPAAWAFVLLILSIPMADKTQVKLKVAQHMLEARDQSLSETVVLGSQTSLPCTERWSGKQLGSYHESDRTLPNLQESWSSSKRWNGDSDSEEEQRRSEPIRQPPNVTESTGSRILSARMLPRISDSRRPRRAFFSECQSLYDKIKSTCNATPFNSPRRSSYTGIAGDDEEGSDSGRPSVQGTAILRKGRGERAQLIDADDFFTTPKDSTPIQRTIEYKKPNLTPWSKSKPLTGRPQSGQSRFGKKFSTDYGTIDMACIGSKIKADLSSVMEAKSQKASRKLRNMRAKSASLVEKTS